MLCLRDQEDTYRRRHEPGSSRDRGHRAPTSGCADESNVVMARSVTAVSPTKGRTRPTGEKARGEVIELTTAQVDQIVRASSGGGSMTVLMFGLDRVRDILKYRPEHLKDSHLSRSLLFGLLLLAFLPDDPSDIAVTALARRIGASNSTTHRYLSTLVAVGLVERDPHTRRYRLASHAPVPEFANAE